MALNKTTLGAKEPKIAANGDEAIRITGAVMVHFFTSQGSFDISLDGGERVPWSTGLRLTVEEGDSVSELRIWDTSGAENKFVIYFGKIKIDDDTLHVVKAAELIQKRPDAAEKLFDDDLTIAKTLIVAADTSTAEVLAFNQGAENVEIFNATDDLIDVLAPGEKTRYITTAGIQAATEANTSKALFSRFFF